MKKTDAAVKPHKEFTHEPSGRKYGVVTKMGRYGAHQDGKLSTDLIFKNPKEAEHEAHRQASDWWNDMSEEEKKNYLQIHPKSKLAAMTVGQVLVVAATKYQEYKKAHPGTKKKPSDPEFKETKKAPPQKGKSGKVLWYDHRDGHGVIEDEHGNEHYFDKSVHDKNWKPDRKHPVTFDEHDYGTFRGTKNVKLDGDINDIKAKRALETQIKKLHLESSALQNKLNDLDITDKSGKGIDRAKQKQKERMESRMAEIADEIQKLEDQLELN